MTRYVIFGAGAVGGVIGACLHRSGHDVVLVARGAHYDALRRDGLRLIQHDADETFAVPTVARIADARPTPDDVVMLGMKTQHTAPALDELRAVADLDTPIVCAQNGVENERLALRVFRHVYAMTVMCPTGHLQPGVVEAYSAPITGLLDLGRYPHGTDARIDEVAAALRASTFESIVRPDIMRWKYAKLLVNLNNALAALFAPGDALGGIVARLRAEGETVLAAAGIDAVSEADDLARRGDRIQMRTRGGGSSWQSLQRGTGNVETDYLNGEISLLGRLHGVPTPINDRLTALMARAARAKTPPGAHDAAAEVGDLLL